MSNSSNFYKNTKSSIDHIPSKTDLVKSLPDGLKHIDRSPQDYTVLWILASFIIVRAVFVLIIPAIRRVEINEKQVAIIGNCQEIPCKNCRYFANNNYLKCAVHPTVVSTRQALNCSDYWPE